MGSIHQHEFVTAAGVVDAAAWSFDNEFVPGMREAIGAVTDRCV